jgi:hypothetical protein
MNPGITIYRLIATVGLVVAASLVLRNSAQANLIAFYPFEGSAADLSGNGNDGIEFGTTLTGAGFEGSAFQFDGVNDFIRIPVNVNPGSLPVAFNVIALLLIFEPSTG